MAQDLIMTLRTGCGKSDGEQNNSRECSDGLSDKEDLPSRNYSWETQQLQVIEAACKALVDINQMLKLQVPKGRGYMAKNHPLLASQ